MIMTSQQLIALLPLLIVGFTAVTIITSISWQRNHFINTTLTIIGLSLALLSLYFVVYIEPIEISSLIYIDNFFILYTGLILLTSLLTCMLAYVWLNDYSVNQDEFYLLVLIITMGGILLAAASHMSTLFLGIELISLPLFGVIGFIVHQKHSLEASIKYTLLSSVVSSFILFGIALFYADTGQLSFVDIKNTFTIYTLNQPLLLVGFGMILVGIAFKLSLVPFHLWTPDVYEGASTPAVLLLANTSKIAIFLVLVRLFLYIPLTNNENIRIILSIIAFSSILFGNLMALSQENIKRILGYSSITHMGYLLTSLITVRINALALETIGVYLIGYIFTNLGIFSVINLISKYYSSFSKNIDSIRFYHGLFWREPLLSLAMTLMIFSLAGIPMTLGFIGKFYVIMNCIDKHLSWLANTVVISSSIGIFYYLRIIINLYYPSSLENHCQKKLFSKWSMITNNMLVLFFSFLILLFGFYPQPLIKIIQWAHPFLKNNL